MRVLIVEDETSVREVFRDLVTALGHEAIPVESAERGLENLQHDQAEAVLLDVRLPGMSGLAFLEHPEVRAAGVPIVVVSGMASEDEARACLRLGALDYLRKPVTLQRGTGSAGTCTQLSALGMRVRTAARLRAGRTVRVGFAPPDAGGPLEAVALVTRVDGDGVALWFMDLVPSETHR